MRFEKAGYLPVDRTVKTRWQDYAWATEDVAMVPLDDHASEIDLSAPLADAQVARGNSVTPTTASARRP